MRLKSVVLVAAIVSASSGSAQAFVRADADSLPTLRKEKLSTFEKSFKPSEYDADIELVHKKENQPRPIIDVPVETFTVAEPETVQGFRIQVLSSNNYDEAITLRNTLNIELPAQWVYMVYDAPTYKIRVGDYTNRADANLAVDGFIEKGFKGAWVVPDRVLKNPQPKPATPAPSDTTGNLKR